MPKTPPSPAIPPDDELLAARFGVPAAPAQPDGAEEAPFTDDDLETMRRDAVALAEALRLRGALGLANEDHLAGIEDPAEPEEEIEPTDFPVDAAFVESANPAQLHDEARGSYAPDDWPASLTSTDDGTTWVYRVGRDDLSAADKTRVTKALSSHVPDPTYGRSPEDVRLEDLKEKAKTEALSTAEVDETINLLIRRGAFDI